MMILDFYVDEPSCLGVPPYLSPYVRYTAGALVDGGVPPEKIEYFTVDQWREAKKNLPSEPEFIFLIAGSTVPGKYLGGRIGTVPEVIELLEFVKKKMPRTRVILGGPIRHCLPQERSRINELDGILVSGDLELYAHLLARGERDFLSHPGPWDDCRQYDQVARWAVRGAFITNLHPGFPHLMMELETYRGCTRTPHCSFCTEALYGKPTFRQVDSILEEVAELYRMGNVHYRLGRQADLLTFHGNFKNITKGFPQPEPAKILELYSGIRRVAPGLKTLHLDNINPGGIAAHPVQSSEALKIITDYNTPGDTAAMGVESVDLEVIRLNHLKAGPEEVQRAIEIVNEHGARRVDGIPSLLPGLNFIHGLPGETESTFQKNFEFLKGIREKGLLLRRTNIRQVSLYEGTGLSRGLGQANQDDKKLKRLKNKLHERFVYYREKIRNEIDRPMLLDVFPPGSILKDVILEGENQGYFYGRPPGSYPVTVKIPRTIPGIQGAWEERRLLNVIITGSEERSLTAILHPIPVNRMNTSALRHIPGIGKKRAGALFLTLPISDFGELEKQLDSRPFARPEDYRFD